MSQPKCLRYAGLMGHTIVIVRADESDVRVECDSIEWAKEQRHVGEHIYQRTSKGTWRRVRVSQKKRFSEKEKAELRKQVETLNKAFFSGGES